MKNLILSILISVLGMAVLTGHAQFKITDNGNQTINANAILDLESDSLGLLPPRMAINSLTSAAPLIGTVTEGMTVYSSGGSVPNGYYCWDGSKWNLILNSNSILPNVTKTANGTLTQSERLVLATNNITLTLPQITSAVNGLCISIKNIGTYTDLVKVIGYAGAKIDEVDTATLTRFQGMTFEASNGKWYVKEKITRNGELLDVSSKGSWRSINEVIAYLNMHMTSPTVVRLCDPSYSMTGTITINLPYPLTIEGLSYGETSIVAGPGLTNKPMFRCLSECYFKMIVFDGSTLTNYGNNAGEDAVRFIGANEYHEIKDAYFYTFNKAIVDSSNTEIWIFDTDFENIKNKAVEITGNGSGAIFKISESDFSGCARGIDLKKATQAIISIINCGFYGSVTADSAIIYRPSTFGFKTLAITNNTWNNTGVFISGFDFTRSDARDAAAEIMNNIGMENKNPHCKINVVNNTSTVTLTNANAWYKIPWTNTTTYTCKWTINGNRITYQSPYKRDVMIIICGNIQVNNSNRNLTVGIVKNNVTTTRYGETTLRITAANQPFQFSTVIYVEDIVQNEYLELFVSSTNAGDVITVQDINWFVNAQ
jgi:hypothetical protein